MIRSIWINKDNLKLIEEHVEMYGGNVNGVINEAIEAYFRERSTDANTPLKD